jgi:spore coat polysaccharide biosynthesis predicted glycosyltransferase SpsG/RimJ/RimL family protein N-acetyltransferase
MARTVVIRCDGGATLGAGHVARCLPVADALARRGVDVRFAGTYEGLAAELVRDHTVVPPAGSPSGVPPDADAVIVDSYAVGPDELARADAERPVLAVIDDGSRPPVTLVLAYQLDAEPGPNVLAGPDYAPVQPRVVAARRARRDSGRGLVVLGGGTTGADLMPRAVEAVLAETDLAVEVAGAITPPDRRRVTALGPVRDLGARFGDYELAVTGAGFTKYEAACAGLPAVFVVVADNQAPGAAAFAERRLAEVVDARAGATLGEFRRAVAAARDGRMAVEGPRLVDGAGAMRVADALLARLEGTPPPPVLRFRPAARDDAARLLAWRNDPEVRAVSGTTHEVKPDEHAAWLERVLVDEDRELLIVERGGEPVATVRFDRVGPEAEISISIAAAHRGGGLASHILRQATELQLASRPALARVVAKISVANERSRRAFERAGYVLFAEQDGWLTMHAHR